MSAKILLVDDKEENLFALSKLLEKEKRQIFTADSGEKALRMALEHDFALIMLDVQMPEMDGYEVVSILKSNRKTENIPVIFVTAISKEESHVLKGFKQGAVDFLFKPLHHDITRAKVDSFIRIYEQQKQLEKQNEQLLRLNTMVQHAVSGICIVRDRDFIITEMNNAFSRITGIDQEKEEQSFLDILSPDDFSTVKEKMLRQRKQKKPLHIEADFIRPENTTGTLFIGIAYIKDCWYVSISDITEKKNAEKAMIRAYLDLEEKIRDRTTELLVANKDMQEFVGAVSHDLRAPLRGISSLAHWIIEDCTGIMDEKGTESLELLRQRVERMDNMIRAVVEYSRIGKTVVSHEPAKTGEVIEEALRQIDVPANITLKIKPGLPEVRFNREYLTEVFRELISNAIRFNDKKKGIIEIGGLEHPDFWELVVSDNGTGIAKSKLKDIFKVFYYYNPSGQEQEHVGMGLPLVKKIISMKKGKIWAVSTPGKLTEIHFTIPKEGSLPLV